MQGVDRLHARSYLSGMSTTNEMRTLRKQAGLTMGQLAEMCDCSVAYISKLERGESIPTTILARKIAHYLRCGEDDLWPAELS